MKREIGQIIGIVIGIRDKYCKIFPLGGIIKSTKEENQKHTLELDY